jgi:hypothetical protein
MIVAAIALSTLYAYGFYRPSHFHPALKTADGSSEQDCLVFPTPADAGCHRHSGSYLVSPTQGKTDLWVSQSPM